MATFFRALFFSVFIGLGIFFFLSDMIITIPDDPETDAEFFISTVKIQRQGNYEILRESLSKKTFSDNEVKLISKCSDEKIIDFVNSINDYDSPLPYLESQEEMNDHFISLIKRKVLDDFSIESMQRSFDSSCIYEVKEGIYK